MRLDSHWVKPRQKLATACAGTLLFLAAVQPLKAAWPLAQPERSATRAADHILIKFHEGVRSRFDGEFGTNGLKELTARLGLPPGAGLTRTRFEELQRRGLVDETRIPLSRRANRHLYLRLPSGLPIDDCLERLRGHPLVEYAEPDGVIHGALVVPDDPQFGSQWYHLNTYSNNNVRADIHTPEAWEITTGSTNVIVGLLDTGLNHELAEFAGRVVPGYNFANDNTNTMDNHLHGTAIAALLAANPNNGVSIAGVDWNCKLMPIKILNDSDRGLVSWYVDGIDFAVAQGCKVLNLSFAHYSDQPTQTVARAISDAVAQGVIVVGLADNGGFPSITFPGNHPDVITVGSSGPNDYHVWSNYGPEVDVIAPGTQIWTIDRAGNGFSGEGNSASVPMVSGAITLLASLRPDIDAAMAWTLLCAGADDRVGRPEHDTPGYDIRHGWGRLNVFNSLILAQTRIQNMELQANGDISFSWKSPPNGAMRRPFRIEAADSPNGPWMRLASSSNITYTADQAAWTDDGAESHPASQALPQARYYRIRVVVESP